MLKRAAAVILAAAALLLVSGALGPRHTTPSADPAPADRLVTSIERAQQRLKQVPGDWGTWASLGSSYVEQARITGNPAFYPRAEAALNESQRLHPNDVALVGLGALANSRHDFTLAASLARQALEHNGYSAAAHGVLVDALTQLGEADAATEAVQRMLDLDPGLPALSRAAYDLEQRGRVEEARALWARALRDAHGSNATFVHQQLGDLAWHEGDLATAESEYRLARHKLGLARIHAARGETSAALTLYAELTAAQPTVSLLAEYSILLSGQDPNAAQVQLRLAEAALALLAANGAADNLAAAEVAIARGDYATAASLCEQEWQRRKHTDVADLLGWSLHLAGRDAEALVYAQKATALGIHHRDYTAHLHAIEESLK